MTVFFEDYVVYVASHLTLKYSRVSHPLWEESATKSCLALSLTLSLGLGLIGSIYGRNYVRAMHAAT